MSDERKARDYRDLLVWQKGIGLARSVYEITSQFPPDERFGLISQMRRAAISVPSNIAEGQARHTTGEFVQSISHAEGSLAELDTQLFMSTELSYCSTNQVAELHNTISDLRKMVNALRSKLNERRR